MRKFGLLGTSALRSAVFVGVTMAAVTPSYAQIGTDPAEDTQPETLQGEVEIESGENATQGEEITVTGSRIRRPNLVSSVPITSVAIEELAGGDVSIGDALNELPALRSTFSQANSTRFIGTVGLSLLDLRGLGTTRTLVLVNGRRHVTSTPGSFDVDVNTIPADLIERVDVITGGSSAIYGSDAVAGVVNFILKRDFEGVRVRGQAGISDEGDRGNYFVSLTAGQNFADDRGNIAVNLEYARQRPLFFTSRDNQTGAFSGRSQFNAVENTIGEPSTGNGTPDNAFFRGIRNNNISEGGLFTSFCPAATATNAARRAANCVPGLRSNTGQELGRTFVFTPDGSLIANPCVTDFRPFGSSNCVGGLGSTLRLTGQLQPGLERKMVNVIASFEISPAFQPFIEAKYVNIDALQEGQPTFNFNTFSINNPFLSAQARNQLVTSLAPGATTFGAFRFNTDFGGRGEEHQRETYRVVAGVRGDFNEDWNYEVAFNYGKLDTFYQTNGNVLTAEFGRSINAVRNASGQIVCAVNADASTANDDPRCVPVNLFGEGNVSQAALDYFGFTSTRDQKAQQYNATAFVSGDLSQLFELPGGPVGFALGAEYRRETAFSAFDPVTQSGATFLNRIPTFDPPALEVKEAFGEIRIPILRELPFAQELTLEGAGRVSDYNVGNTGTVFAYNLAAVYAPVRDIRFRVAYARSVRAPTLGNLFGSPSQTFANGLQDPCSAQNINNNPNRVRNCAAAGVPTTVTLPNGDVVPFTNIPSSGVSGFNRGNPELREEEGNSLTAGAVFQPRFLPGFSFSVDYYDITVDNVIFGLSGQTIINQCFDNPSGIDNPFCAVVFRNPNGTFAGQSNRLLGGETVSFPVTGPAFFSQPFNFAKQETAGIDFDAAYRTSIGAGTRLNLRAIVSYVIKRNNFTDIGDPEFADRQKSELGDPEWRGQFSADVDFGQLKVGYQLQYIGKQTIGDFELQNPFQGRPARNPDAFPRVFYPDVFYHNFRAGYEVNDRFEFYGGVDNAFDRLPPLGLLGTEAGSPFDPTGRFFYVGATAKF